MKVLVLKKKMKYESKVMPKYDDAKRDGKK